MASIKYVIQVQGDITNARTAETGLMIVTHILKIDGKCIAKIFRGKDISLLYCQVARRAEQYDSDRSYLLP